ncbi:MAG: hypothetical protein BJ554DRAFT_7372 [Olpidium bornovanus]|uniref:Uncharacterized protein n=1 Tax=Olpidium bornovanus TaxID=278681 RepID=A0A8H8DMY3_9FUNG|nr:MAG: hypothetical protein BJ554DRAFT_7372 [Olpidium bornovanus]
MVRRKRGWGRLTPVPSVLVARAPPSSRCFADCAACARHAMTIAREKTETGQSGFRSSLLTNAQPPAGANDGIVDLEVGRGGADQSILQQSR